jgi:hypothetical protein
MDLKDRNTAVEQFATPERIPANLDAIVKWLDYNNEDHNECTGKLNWARCW